MSLVLILFSFSSCCNEQRYTEEVYSTLKISEVRPSLVSDKHESEGIVLTMPDGEIWNFFRVDDGVYWRHASNSGAIYKRYSLDNAETWSEPELLIDDPSCDDRNIGGGMTDDGDIIIFYRRYKLNYINGALTGNTIDVNYLISHDHGETFSKRIPLNGIKKLPMRFISAGHNKYYIPLYDEDSEIRTFSVSGDSVAFSSNAYIFKGNNLEEPELSMDNGKIVCLFRSDFGKGGLYQCVSTDNGKTFSDAIQTNIISDMHTSLPCFFFERKYTHKAWVIVGDRKVDSSDSKLWIYNCSFDSIVRSSQTYLLYKSIDRPKPSKYMLYGYPTVTLMKNGKYLVLFTETHNDGNENADIYQFTMEPLK